jgi:acyl-CoA synthetase (AMP-forming)/AMP-acid ligase II
VPDAPSPAGLLEWLSAPSASRGMRFAQDDGGWALVSYAELAARSFQVAARLGDEGLPAGSVVALVLPTGPAFVASYYGALLAGHTPCPVNAAHLVPVARGVPRARGVAPPRHGWRGAVRRGARRRRR